MGQLEDMTVFIRVVDAGGISRAAEQLGMAKSAVSRRLVELEKRLGVLLLNRTTRKSSLTEAGQNLYDRAIKITEDVEELNSMISDAHTGLEGAINFAAPVSFGISHLSAAVDEFVAQNPNITMNIDFSDRQVDLVEEGLDLGFRIAELKDSTLIARRVCPIRLVLCASPEYLEKFGTPQTPADLQQHRLLHYSMPGRNYWLMFDAENQPHRIPVKSRIQANNGEFLREMAVAGNGLVATPTFISWQAIKSGKLIPVLNNYKFPDINAYAVYPKNRYLSQRVRTFIEFLIHRFGETPYWD